MLIQQIPSPKRKYYLISVYRNIVVWVECLSVTLELTSEHHLRKLMSTVNSMNIYPFLLPEMPNESPNY